MKLEVGRTFDGSFMVKRLEVKTASNGKLFLSGEVFDRDGVTSCVIWDPPTVAREPQPGDVLEAKWKVKEFNGKLQLDVVIFYAQTKAELVEDASAYVRQSSVTKAAWLSFYNAEMRPLIEDKWIEQLIDKVLETTPFFQAPAAKGMHQNWRGGLAEHVYRILHLYWGLLKSGHPTLEATRKGVVIAGIVLHDYAKAYEYAETAPGQYEVSSWGTLMGHLAGGPIMLMPLLAELEFDPVLLQHVMHVLLAHHGQVDWGSPIVPATREAVLVHFLDNLDGRLSMLEETPAGQYNRGLGCKPQAYEQK